MARIGWALLCDHAFLDRVDQLSIIGIARNLIVPRLPCARSSLMLVARLVDIGPIDEIEVTVRVLTPSGTLACPNADQATIEVCHEYVLVTLFDVPLFEEGPHRFQIELRGQPAAVVEMPVILGGVNSPAVLQ